MTGLFVVRRRVQEAATDSRSAAGRALQQLVALDRVEDCIRQVCQRLAIAADCATRLHTKIQCGTQAFVNNWNDAHPDELIQRCRGAESNSNCARYTTNELAVCDACRSQRGQR
jgi:hypothetical protein